MGPISHVLEMHPPASSFFKPLSTSEEGYNISVESVDKYIQICTYLE
jgi:hypothetical protein